MHQPHVCHLVWPTTPLATTPLPESPKSPNWTATVWGSPYLESACVHLTYSGKFGFWRIPNSHGHKSRLVYASGSGLESRGRIRCTLAPLILPSRPKLPIAASSTACHPSPYFFKNKFLLWLRSPRDFASLPPSPQASQPHLSIGLSW